MPIKIICEKRHHKSEPDISYPAVFCDACGKRITEAAKANYYWRANYDLEKDQFYNQQNEVFFLHCECDRKIQAMLRHCKGKHFSINTPFGTLNSEDVDQAWQPLESFPLWLGLNMGMNINATEMSRYRSNDTKGKDITTDTYPVGENGWVYFVVDNGSIERKLKIGHSKNVYARLKNMQTGSASILKCYGAIRGTEADEQLAHNLLKEYNTHGEWFVFQDIQDIVDEWLEIGSVCPSVV